MDSGVSIEKETRDLKKVDESVENKPNVFSSRIGIIIPPPEVKGIEFEERIRLNEANNQKFNFLYPNDPYHGYYRHVLKRSSEGVNKQESNTGESDVDSVTASNLTFNAKKFKEEESQQETAAITAHMSYYETLLMNETGPSYQMLIEIPKLSDVAEVSVPKPYNFFMSHPNIFDIMKVTAMFVAKGGRLFLNNLMQREHRNYFFDFLKPQHSLYSYFLALVDQYTSVMNPLPSMLTEIRACVDNNQAGLIKKLQDRCFFEKQRVDQKEREDEERERDRIAFAQIDWHDFVIVEQVSLLEEDKATLPPPVSLEKLGERLLAQERYEAMRREQEEQRTAAAAATAAALADTKQKSLGKSVHVEQQNPVLGASTVSTDDVNEDLTSKSSKRPYEAVEVSSRAGLTSSKAPTKAASKDKLMVSPITGELIPADSIAQHLKISLLDPRYKEQKEHFYRQKKQQDEVFTVGSSMVSHLKEMAQHRSDIFGPSTQETQIGKKIEDYHPIENSVAKSAVPMVQQPVVTTNTPPPLISSPMVNSTHHSNNASKPPVANLNVITKVPEGLSQPPQQYPGAVRHPVMHSHPSQMLHQATSYGLNNTPPVGLPPPIFNQRMPPGMMPPGMMPPPPPPGGGHFNMMATANQQNPFGVRAHGLPPVSADPYAKQTNPLESMLIPEAVFLSSNAKHDFTLKIKMPVNEELKAKHGWKLEGQFVSISANMTWKLKTELTKVIGVPPSKQKLTVGQGFFMKDANSLAYYNLMDSSFVNLQIKERGGRNK